MDSPVVGVGLCTCCGKEIEKLWEGGYKVREIDGERTEYLAHHLCPETKEAIWAMLEKLRSDNGSDIPISDDSTIQTD